MARMELGREMHEAAKAAEGLRTAEKLAAVGRMASSIAHEINNPLQSVTNLLFMIENTDEREPRQQYLRMAQDELSRVTQIATQSLRFHRQSVAAMPTRLGELAESALLLYRTRLSHAGVRVHLRDTQTADLLCYAEDVRHAISNLVANALDGLQGAGGGDLYVRIHNNAHGAVLVIADNGSGIAPEAMGRLFQPFNTTKGIRGTGLGLWITKGILDKHGATIRVRSSKNTGTIVRIVFPSGSSAPTIH
jgi:two-component system NtrC family sensor kinase